MSNHERSVRSISKELLPRFEAMAEEGLAKIKHPKGSKEWLKARNTLMLEIYDSSCVHLITYKALAGLFGLHGMSAKIIIQRRDRNRAMRRIKPALLSMDTDVESMATSVAAYNCMNNAGIKTVGQLIQYTASDLMRTKNFGRKSVHEIREWLENAGFHVVDSATLGWYVST